MEMESEVTVAVSTASTPPFQTSSNLDEAMEVESENATSVNNTEASKGIAAADLDGVALRHTTSKLSEFDDLQKLRSYGFRGEALNSLAALSTRLPARLSIDSIL